MGEPNRQAVKAAFKHLSFELFRYTILDTIPRLGKENINWKISSSLHTKKVFKKIRPFTVSFFFLSKQLIVCIKLADDRIQTVAFCCWKWPPCQLWTNHADQALVGQQIKTLCSDSGKDPTACTILAAQKLFKKYIFSLSTFAYLTNNY